MKDRHASNRQGGARALLVGLGNPILRDDAVGLAVARQVYRILGPVGLELRELAVGGLELVEILTGYEKAVVIDAIVDTNGAVGECFRLDLTGASSSQRAGMAHAVGLLDGLALSSRLGLTTPGYLRVYAIKVADPFSFGEEMTPALVASLPGVAARIAREVGPELGPKVLLL